MCSCGHKNSEDRGPFFSSNSTAPAIRDALAVKAPFPGKTNSLHFFTS